MAIKLELMEHLQHGHQVRANGTPVTLPQGYRLLNTCNMAIMVRVHGTPVS